MKAQNTRIGTLIERNYKQLKSIFLKTLKNVGLDLTTDQWIILDALHNHGTLSQNELSELSFKSTATISRSIDLLVQKGLIHKEGDENDRRRVKISLTKTGESTVAEGEDVAEDLRLRIGQDISEEEFKELRRLLNKIYDNINEISLSS